MTVAEYSAPVKGSCTTGTAGTPRRYQMDREEVYQKAWTLLQNRLERKTSWGKLEVKMLMGQCLKDALDDSE
jgi:hypothetical protein